MDKPSFQVAVEFSPVTNEMSRIDVTSEYLSSFITLIHENLSRACNEYRNDKVFFRHLDFLREMVDRLYLPGTPNYTLEEALSLSPFPDNTKKLWKDFPTTFILPFLKQPVDAGGLQGSVESDLRKLIGPCHVITDEDLMLIAGRNPKIKRFVIDVFAYSPFDFAVYKSFKDKNLEVLYSNDGLSLSKTDIRKFADFFVSGNGDNNAEYDPSKYYGGTPVSEDTVKAYLKAGGMSNDSILKIMAIMKVSKRFYCEQIDSKDCYCLKTQYLYNTQAYSVAILYQEGKPLHLEEIHRRIAKLARQFPNLVDAPRETSMQLRRKPVIGSSGKMGQRRLMIWGESESLPKIDTYEIIRSFVEKEYSGSGEPVPFEAIEEEVRRCGLNYPPRSLRTYCTTVCTSIRGKGFIPQGVEKGDTRAWIRRLPELQRLIASCIYDSKRALTYKEIMTQLAGKGYSVSKRTLISTIDLLPDVFIKDKAGILNVYSLSETIRTKSDIKSSIPDNDKGGNEEREKIKQHIAAYLFNRPDYKAPQKDIIALFEKEITAPIKSRGTAIRHLLNDKEVFVKEKHGNSTERMVSLYPLFVERMKLQELLKPSAKESGGEDRYNYVDLKKAIVTRECTFFRGAISEKALSDAVDGMVRIMKMDKDAFPADSSFVEKELLQKLHAFYCLKTSPKERETLRENILALTECYLKNFGELVHNKQYAVSDGLGAVIYDLASYGDLPPKANRYQQLSQYDYELSSQVYKIIHPTRNQTIGHLGNTTDRSDKKNVEVISACIHTFLHLSWRRMIHSGKLPYSVTQ